MSNIQFDSISQSSYEDNFQMNDDSKLKYSTNSLILSRDDVDPEYRQKQQKKQQSRFKNTNPEKKDITVIGDQVKIKGDKYIEKNRVIEDNFKGKSKKINWLYKPTDKEIEEMNFKCYDDFLDHWVHALYNEELRETFVNKKDFMRILEDKYKGKENSLLWLILALNSDSKSHFDPRYVYEKINLLFNKKNPLECYRLMFSLVDQHGKGVISIRQFKNFLKTTSFLDVLDCIDPDFLLASLKDLPDDETLSWEEFEEIYFDTLINLENNTADADEYIED